ncbi:MAG: hypothetical protein NXI19_03770 [Alphaproteobacteria bacterium]|nr:hypothetical protein [Alphaproteobacteria bacterium]
MSKPDAYPETDEDPLTRALGYPYPTHPEDYLFTGAQAEPLPADFSFAGLTPVIAVGSNRSPRQLERKFAPRYMSGPVRIPVTRIKARGVDVVFAAHLAGYGSAPATLARSPGAVTELWVNWLDGPALDRMDATEGLGVHYDRVSLPLEVASVDPARPAPETMLLYAARCGLLTRDGSPVAVAEIPSEGRSFPVMSQIEMLRHLHSLHRRDEAHGFEDWLLGIIGQTGQKARDAIEARIIAEALPMRF